MSQKPHHNLGITLLEVMISMTLSVVILFLLTQLYINQQSHVAKINSITQLQNNASTAIQLLKNEIRQAGNIGCARLEKDFTVIPYDNYMMTAENKLQGEEHAVTVRYATTPLAVVIQETQDATSIRVDQNAKFKLGEILLISDCTKAEVFQVEKIITTADSKVIKPRSPLRQKYLPFAEVAKLSMNTFYIGKTNRRETTGLPIYSLFIKDIANRRYELVEGISDMQIKYTILTKQGLQYQIRSENVLDWSQVVGISIKLSVENSGYTKPWYTFIKLNHS